MAFFRGVAALGAIGRSTAIETPQYAYYGSSYDHSSKHFSADETPNYGYYGSTHLSAEETPNYSYYGSKHLSAHKTPNYDYYGSKHLSAEDITTCGFQGTVCGGIYDPVHPGGGGIYNPVYPGGVGIYDRVYPGGTSGGNYNPGRRPHLRGNYNPVYPPIYDPVYPGGPSSGNYNPVYPPIYDPMDGVINDPVYPGPGGSCSDPRGCAKDDLPGIPLTAAQLDLVQKIASQAADGLKTTIQLLQQDRQSGPVGNLFEQIFSNTHSQNLADEQFVQDRLQDVLEMMTAHSDRVEYVYCTEGETDYDCPEDQGVVAYVLSGGKFGETDMSKFSVHLGKIWWNAIEEWGEACKAGVLIHEYTHHVFHTRDLGYNFEGKALTDDEKKQNAAAYQNLVVGVMVARQKKEL